MNLCGHATLATAFVIFEVLKLEDKNIKFLSHRSGELRVEKQGDRFVLDFPAYPMTEIENLPQLADVEVPPVKSWEAQGNMLFMLLRDPEEVRSLSPICTRCSVPYEEYNLGQGCDCDFVSRMFAPRIGILRILYRVLSIAHLFLLGGELGKDKLLHAVSPTRRRTVCELADDTGQDRWECSFYLKGGSMSRMISQ